MIICLCGRSNSGKGTIAKTFTCLDNNIIHLDIDKIAHHVNDKEEVKEELVDTFSLQVLDNGKINRKKLASIVFNDKDEMKKLEAITWKHMEKEIDSYISDNKKKIIILDYIMLPKTKYFETSDLKILVKASYEERLKRAIIRDNITKELFDQRDGVAINFVDEDFDYVIDNGKGDVKRKVVKIYEQSIISR